MTNHFEIEGKFLRIDTRAGKGGKVFETLVIEVDGNYPQFVPFRLWGRTAGEAKNWRPGDALLVKGTLGGRQWEGRVFADNSANSVEVVARASEPAGATPAREAEDPGSIPFWPWLWGKGEHRREGGGSRAILPSPSPVCTGSVRALYAVCIPRAAGGERPPLGLKSREIPEKTGRARWVPHQLFRIPYGFARQAHRSP